MGDSSHLSEDGGKFDATRKAMLGLPTSHVWRGHGSAIFLEFGDLTPTLRRNGQSGEPSGQFGIMIEWSWRIEQGARIVCGSWSDEGQWPVAFEGLKGSVVEHIGTFGALPEILIALSNGMRVLSFMTTEGDPGWALFDRRGDTVTFHSRRGQVSVER
jgi:hypothetical protein